MLKAKATFSLKRARFHILLTESIYYTKGSGYHKTFYTPLGHSCFPGVLILEQSLLWQSVTIIPSLFPQTFGFLLLAPTSKATRVPFNFDKQVCFPTCLNLKRKRVC